MRLSGRLSLFPILCMLFCGITAPTWAEDSTEAIHKERETFARQFAQAVINIIRDPKTSYSHRQEILRNSFSKSMDIDWIAKFVLGRPWKDATDEQRETYVSLYRRFLTETYVTRFAENPDNGIYDIKITGVYDAEENNTFTVHTQTQLMNHEKLKVDYLVGDTDRHYKVMDIIIENVSLIESHRAEFTALTNEGGIESVITRLQSWLDHSRETRLSMK